MEELKIKLNGNVSKDRDYLSKKAWRERNKEKDRESKKKWLENNKEKRKEVSKKYSSEHLIEHRVFTKNYSKKYPEKVLAQKKARIIKMDSRCNKCGCAEKLERHHPDYSKPLYVITLCKCCHMGEHYGKHR